MEDKKQIKIQKILAKNYMLPLKNDINICDICENIKLNIYLDKNENILICLHCIKKLTT